MTFFPFFDFNAFKYERAYMCVYMRVHKYTTYTKCSKNVGKMKIPGVIASKKFSFAKNFPY